MEAGTLNCPMCGAAASTDATSCEHCGARLATVACPACFGLMFIGEKFCSHCGAAGARVDVEPAGAASCPRCLVNMGAVTVGSVNLLECPRCNGLWLDVPTLEQLCADSDRQTAILGVPSLARQLAPARVEEVIRYIRCPVCAKVMNRVNFASHSGVVVDVCRGHGTWFDRDELRRVVEFIRDGGLEKARAEERKADARASKSRPGPRTYGGDFGDPLSRPHGVDWGDWGDATSIFWQIAGWLLRR